MNRYLIDGYNLLFYLINDIDSLEKSRNLFISLVKKRLPKAKITIVFDGKTFSRSFLGDIELLYASNADRAIIEELESAQNPKIITVISSDKELLRLARSLGAKTETKEVFTKRLELKKLPEEKPLNENSFRKERLLRIFLEKLKKEY